MVIFIAFPMLLLAAAMLTLIIYAIVSKKWALLFIPAGLIMLVAVLAGLYLVPSSSNVQYSRTAQSPPATVELQPTDVLDHTAYDDATVSARTAEYNRNTNMEEIRYEPTGVHIQAMKILSLVAILALLALVVLVIIAIVRKKWVLLFIPLGLAGLLFIGGVFFRVGHSSSPSGLSPPADESVSSVVSAGRALMVESAPEQHLPSVWSPGIEKEFTTNTYYSMSSALRGIAGRLDKMFAQMALNGKPIPAKFALLTYKDQFSKELNHQAISIFQEILPDTEFFHISEVTASFGSDWLVDGKWNEKDNWISLGLTETSVQDFNIPAASGKHTGLLKAGQFKSGNIKVNVNLNNQKYSYDLKFTEKPWLENIAAFQNSYPSRQFTIAYSQSSCRTLNNAVRQASSHASQIVSQMIIDINRSITKTQRGRLNFSVSSEDLYQHGIIIDNSTQSFTGSASPIYRQALLLDVSLDRIMPLAEKKLRLYNMQRQSWTYQIFSAIGIALAICIIYLILNAATRGYYTAVLRIMAVIGIIVVIGIIAVVVLFLNMA